MEGDVSPLDAKEGSKPVADEEMTTASTSPVASRRKPRGKQIRTATTHDSDEEDYAPKKKRAKPAAKKTPVEKPLANSPASGGARSKKKVTKSEPMEVSGQELESVPVPQALQSSFSVAGISSADSLAQYQGIPLEELRNYLTPQEYVKLSIMRSIAESAQTGSEKNVHKNLHPDLAPTQQCLNWETELRSMVGTWVELPLLTQSCLELLEAEATRYTRILLKDLFLAVDQHRQTGSLNGRVQKHMMYSNQAQRIDLKFVKVTDVEKTLESSLSSSHPSAEPVAASTENRESEEKKPTPKSTSAREGDADTDDEDGEYEYNPDRAFESDSDDKPKSKSHSAPVYVAPQRTTHLINAASGYDRIPIVTVDHLAEALSLRDVSLVRRLEYICKRLAEDEKAQRMSKEAENEKTIATELAQDSSSEEEDDEDEDGSLQDLAWAPSPELEQWLSKRAPEETFEKHHQMRETIMSERMARVEVMPTAKLDDWQNQSSISFIRSLRGIPKFKSWLAQCCLWDTRALCLPAQLLVIINFLTYEHVRYIVRCSISISSSSSSSSAASAKTKPTYTLLAENLRKEIEYRHKAGDAVRISPLFSSSTS